MKIKYYFLPVSIGLIAGCATSPKPMSSVATVQLPETWETKADTSNALPTWIEYWQIEELNQLIALGLENNRDVGIAEARLAGAMAELKIVGADSLPSLNGGVTGRRGKQILAEDPNIISATGNNFEASMSLSWEIDLWARIRDQKKAFTGEAEATLYDLKYIQLSLVSQIAKLWFSLTEANLQLELAQKTADSYETNAKQIEAQYLRGIADALDFHLIQAQSSNAKAELAFREQTRDELRRALNILIGNYPSKHIETAASFPSLPDSIPTLLPSDLLNRRPDLRAAERRLSAAESRVSSAQKLRLPSFSLVGSVGTSSTDLNNIVNSDYQIWNLLGNVTLPIFQAGRITGQINQAKSNYTQAFLNYEQTILQSLEEVENALSAENSLSDRYEYTEIAARQNEAAERIALDRYNRGLTTIITVLEAQRRAFAAESNRISILNQRYQNRINLLLALGGGWTEQN